MSEEIAYKKYEYMYKCLRCGCDIDGVVYGPAYCPKCHKPVETRHPEFYRLRKEYLESKPEIDNYLDYTKYSQK